MWRRFGDACDAETRRWALLQATGTCEALTQFGLPPGAKGRRGKCNISLATKDGGLAASLRGTAVEGRRAIYINVDISTNRGANRFIVFPSKALHAISKIRGSVLLGICQGHAYTSSSFERRRGALSRA